MKIKFVVTIFTVLISHSLNVDNNNQKDARNYNLVAGQFIDYLTKFQVSNYAGVEDFADKFNFLFTVIVLLICTSIVTMKQYILKPISCYISTISGTNLLEYVENYCWVEGTIPISYDGKIPSTNEEWAELNKYKILYYQWVPFLLSLQAIMFYIPRLIWQIFCYNTTGTDIHHLIVSANQAVHSSDEARTKMVNYIAKTIEQMLYQHRDNRNGRLARFRRSLYKICCFCIMSKRQGTRLLCMYFIIKFLYLTNCILQLYFMKSFLGLNEAGIFFGFKIMKNIINGQDWKSTLVFPRVGYCYVNVKNVGTTNALVAQCVLPVNMLNEKIFFFLWCWIFSSAILLTISIIIWIFRTSVYQRRRGFIYRFLKLNQQLKNCDEEKCMVVKFEHQFLRYDGVFLLKMISLNAGDIVAADIVCQLWKIFKSQYANRNFLSDGSDDDENHGRTLIRLDNNNHSKPSFDKSNSLQSAFPSAPISPFDVENSHKKNFRKVISSES